jgi:hypothetical protein
VPDATVVGIDPWPPSLELARANVAEAGLESRVSFVETTIQDYTDDAILELLRPGGQVVVGVTFAGAGDELESAADDLMTVRSGGSVLDPAAAVAVLEASGFADARELERTWNQPLRFVVGTRP